MERHFIRETGANNPAVGYNLTQVVGGAEATSGLNSKIPRCVLPCDMLLRAVDLGSFLQFPNSSLVQR